MPETDHVFLLPGIMGSTLEKSGRDVWAPSLQALLGAAGDRGLEALALGEDPVDREELDDGIRATHLMPTVQILPGFWKVDGYTAIAAELGRRMGLPAARVHLFPYDWRRDNRVAAHRLERAVAGIAAAEPEARFTFVGHSMGGLVARYYVEVLGGWRRTRALFTLGTPHRGSLNAVGVLVNGLSWKLGPLRLAGITATLRTFTSLYQLLPIYPCVQAGSGIRRVDEGGLPHVEAARIDAGVHFHREIEAAVEANLKDPDYRERFPLVFPVVGTNQPTSQLAAIEGDGVRLLRTYPGLDLDGDGTVPRVSATPIEMSDLRRELFTPCMHGMLQNAGATLDQLEGVARAQSTPYGQLRDARPEAPADLRVRLGLALDDLFCGGEPVWLRARPSRQVRSLTAEVRDGRGQPAGRLRLRRAADGWYEPEPGKLRLPPGSYRVKVSGPEAIPIEDVFLVADLPRVRRRGVLRHAAGPGALPPAASPLPVSPPAEKEDLGEVRLSVPPGFFELRGEPEEGAHRAGWARARPPEAAAAEPGEAAVEPESGAAPALGGSAPGAAGIAPAAGTAAEGAARQVMRTPTMASSAVIPGETLSLRVGLAASPAAAGAAGAPFPATAGKALAVHVASDEVEFGVSEGAITVDAAGDSAVDFSGKVKRTAAFLEEIEILATFYDASRLVGSARGHFRVAHPTARPAAAPPGAQPPGAAGPPALAAPAAEAPARAPAVAVESKGIVLRPGSAEPALLVQIIELDGKYLWVHRVGVAARRAAQAAGVALPKEASGTSMWKGGDPQAYVGGIYREVEGRKGAAALALLRGAGARFYAAAPPAFQAHYQALSSLLAPASLTIQFVTDEHVIPWELMLVPGPGGQQEFLGALHPVARWPVDQGPSWDVLPAGKVAVISPSYAGGDELPFAAKERALLTGPPYSAYAVKPANSARVEALLAGELPAAMPTSVVHLACHGLFAEANPDLARVILDGDEDLTALEVADPRNTLGETNGPLVFMNACQVGQAGSMLPGMVGWAATWIGRSYRGVVAPLWSINDAAAFDVSKAFYAHALPRGGAGATTVAEALQQIRAANQAKGPTYLAYVFHGDVAARF